MGVVIQFGTRSHFTDSSGPRAWVKAYENQPARLIFSRSRSAFVIVAFITGRVIGSRRTSRIERMSRWTRSQGCCQAVRSVAIARGQ